MGNILCASRDAVLTEDTTQAIKAVQAVVGGTTPLSGTEVVALLATVQGTQLGERMEAAVERLALPSATGSGTIASSALLWSLFEGAGAPPGSAGSGFVGPVEVRTVLTWFLDATHVHPAGRALPGACASCPAHRTASSAACTCGCAASAPALLRELEADVLAVATDGRTGIVTPDGLAAWLEAFLGRLTVGGGGGQTPGGETAQARSTGVSVGA